MRSIRGVFPDLIAELIADDASFAELVEEFVGGLDSRLAEMRAAFDGGEMNELRMLAHGLRGSGYPALTESALKLEQHARASEVERCRDELDKLTSLIARVVVGPVS